MTGFRVFYTEARMLVFVVVYRMVQWVTEREAEDHMVNPEFPKDKKGNPWVEQKKCSLI